MTDTITPTDVQPIGMTNEQWAEIQWGLNYQEGVMQRALAERCLSTWTTQNELIRERDEAQNSLSTAQQTISKQARYLEVIAEELLAEARRREWCSEYDNYVDTVNARLGEDVLEKCSANYVVTISLSVTVNTRTEDQASDLAGHEVDRLLGRNDNFIDFNAQVEEVNLADD